MKLLLSWQPRTEPIYEENRRSTHSLACLFPERNALTLLTNHSEHNLTTPPPSA